MTCQVKSVTFFNFFNPYQTGGKCNYMENFDP
jgi:hypothetical protein